MRRSRNASNPASVHIAFISAPENSSLVITNSSKLTSSANVILAVCIYNPHIEINCMRELHRFNDEKHKAVRHEITNKSYGMISNTLLPIIKPCVPGKYASLFWYQEGGIQSFYQFDQVEAKQDQGFQCGWSPESLWHLLLNQNHLTGSVVPTWSSEFHVHHLNGHHTCKTLHQKHFKLHQL